MYVPNLKNFWQRNENVMAKSKKSSRNGLFIFLLLGWLVKMFFKMAWFCLTLIFRIVSFPFALMFRRNDPKNGEEYEEYICRQMRKSGYKNIRTTSVTGDHGVDILASSGKKTYAVQCKFYSSNVGNYAVQEAYTGCAYYECDVPVVVTNKLFTKQAKQEAEKLGVELWEENKIPVRRRISGKMFGNIKNPVYKKYIDDYMETTDEVEYTEEIRECTEREKSEEMDCRERIMETETCNEDNSPGLDEFIEITDSDGNKTLVNRQKWLYGENI